MRWLHLEKTLETLVVETINQSPSLVIFYWIEFDQHIIIINPLQNYIHCPYFKYGIKVKWHETYLMVSNLGVTK